MNRPYVICHMCTTIDGKIMGNRWPNIPGVRGSGKLFETTAASFKIGAWIVGTTTMKEFSYHGKKRLRLAPPAPRRDYVAKPKAKRLAIGPDAKGVLQFDKPEVQGDHVVLLVTRRASDSYLAKLRAAGVSYLFCGSEEIDLPTALRKLHRAFGLKKLMLQGGGKFNGSMLEAGLVDEISQVIVPIADGGAGVSGIFDIHDPKQTKSAAGLGLVWQKKLPHSINWFRYKVLLNR
jgi:2,5-diamino-6-(ribosylamino)-4(3H)-pyrimidinone 5'-phosphate reductase